MYYDRVDPLFLGFQILFKCDEPIFSFKIKLKTLGMFINISFDSVVFCVGMAIKSPWPVATVVLNLSRHCHMRGNPNTMCFYIQFLKRFNSYHAMMKRKQ